MLSKAIRALLETKQAELDVLLAKEPGTSDEIKAAVDAGTVLEAELTALKAQLDGALKQEAVAKANRAYLNDPVNVPPAPTAETPEGSETKTIKVLPMHGAVTSFTGATDHEKAVKALRFGHLVLAGVRGRPGSVEFCREYGVAVKALSEGDNTSGGVLVPDEFSADLIKLVDQYGVCRRNAKRRPMLRDQMIIPRRTSGLTAYPVGESTAPTESTPVYGKIELTSRKWGTIAIMSSEIAEDAIIDLGNELAEELALAFAYAEDDALFNGDGGSAYHKILGLDHSIQKQVTDLAGTWTTDANKLYAAPVFNATGNLWSEIVLADMTGVMSRVRPYAYRMPGGVKWYCSMAFWQNVMQRLILSAGGVTGAEIVNGTRQQNFLGFPIEFTEVLPQTDGASTIPCYFGNMTIAVSFGDRRELTVSESKEYRWAQGDIAVQGTERFDLNCHDLGTGNATAASIVKGPLGCLAMNNA